jgi:hypothetical protein
MDESKVNRFRGPLPITLLRSYTERTSTRTRKWDTRAARHEEACWCDKHGRMGETQHTRNCFSTLWFEKVERGGGRYATRDTSYTSQPHLHHARSLNGSRIAHSDTHLWAIRAVVYSTYTVDIVTKHSSITLASYCVNIPTPLSGF